jgi:hypothetical protein
VKLSSYAKFRRPSTNLDAVRRRANPDSRSLLADRERGRDEDVLVPVTTRADYRDWSILPLREQPI